jgi:hypothetical protein
MVTGFIAGWILATGVTVSVWALLWERQRQQMLFFE